jgi:hypothetical protein
MRDAHETRIRCVADRKPSLVVGPVALVAIASLVLGLRNRSRSLIVAAVMLAAMEAWWPPYQAVKRDPRFSDLNLLTIWPESE